MGNLMSTLYIGYVKEIIRDALGVPTFDLRVHVPAIHGFRVSDETKLPIARPLVTPGMTIMQEDLEAIYNDNLIGQRVIVFFESGNKTNPIYLGVVGQKPAGNLQGQTPALKPTIELEVASLTTLTELEKLTIKNQLSSLIVDDKIDGTKFDDIVLVTTNDLIRLHYSSIDYYVANPQITVIFETENTKYTLNVPLNEYTYSTLTSTTTTIPTNTVSSTAITTIVKLTQAEYDLLTPDANTFYVIVG